MPNTNFASGSNNRSMPSATVIPVLHYPDVPTAVAWLCGTFGFIERIRIGTHRAQLEVGDGAIVVAQGLQASQGPEFAAHSVMVRVRHLDRHFEVAKNAGAKVIGEPTSFPYGERQFSVLDPGGHAWTFSQTETNTDPSSWGGELVSGGADAA